MVQARQDGGKVRSCVQALFMHASALHCRRCSRDWISCAGYFQFHESPEKVDKWMDLRRNMLLFHRWRVWFHLRVGKTWGKHRQSNILWTYFWTNPFGLCNSIIEIREHQLQWSFHPGVLCPILCCRRLCYVLCWCGCGASCEQCLPERQGLGQLHFWVETTLEHAPVDTAGRLPGFSHGISQDTSRARR